jgi:hypothetical protein
MMDAVHAVLRRLRGWFLVWFTVEAVAGTAAAAYVLDGMSRHSVLRYATGGVGAAGTILAGLAVSFALLLLAWAVLDALLDLRPWARMVILVIGWITVISATINLSTLPVSSAWLKSLVSLMNGDWAALAAVSVLTRTADLVFWSWVLYTLQANPAVRHAFLHPSQLSAGPDTRCQTPR